MADSSEAECLLRTGTLYTKRIGLREGNGDLVFVGVKRGAFSIYFADAPIYHFDLEGRWQRAFLDGDHYRKSLDQSVDLIGRTREGVNLTLDRVKRSRAEIDALDDKIRTVALDLSILVSEGAVTLVEPSDPAQLLSVSDFHDLMDRVGAWDAAAWFSRREQFVSLYGQQTPFVPLDSQNPIVLDLADPISGEVRTPEAFTTYCRKVARFLGRRAIQANTLFLAGDTAIRRPVEEILANLAAIDQVFPLRAESRPTRPQDMPQDRPSLSGIELFLEAGNGRAGLPDAQGWERLAEARVRRVTVSLASYGDCRDVVRDIKGANLAVSLLVPYGLSESGRSEALADLVNVMPIGRGDFVYLADLTNLPNPGEVGTSPLPASERETQRTSLDLALAPTRDRGAKVFDYNPAKQWM